MMNIIINEVKMIKIKLLNAILIPLSILGILLLSIILHETWHVIHANGKATGVCFVSNTLINDNVQKGYLHAFTMFNINDYENLETYNSFRELTEKWVYFIINAFYIISGIIIGYLLKENKKW